jgi:hypothetical protein
MANPIEIRKPRVDDRPLFDVLLGVWGYPAVLVAHELKLFELLSERPLTLDEVCAAKRIARRPAETLLALCTSIGLLAKKDERFLLTPLAEDYMLPSSPTYYGWFFDAWRPVYSVWSPDSLREAVLTDRPQGGSPILQGPLPHGMVSTRYTSRERCIARAWGLVSHGRRSSI